MCGIVGHLGKFNALDAVLNGLEHLEYRGYDSAGIAYAVENQIFISKEKGRVSELKKIIKASSSTLAIGHTRWATHGEVNRVNAHPHSSQCERFVLVHNGIIELYF